MFCHVLTVLAVAVTKSGARQRLLVDPLGILARFGERAGARGWPVLVIGALALLAARVVVRRGRHARLADGARWVEVLAPPTVDEHAAGVLWAQLHGLARPAWRRLWSGQPHLVFEYQLSSRAVRIGLWVPAGIPPGLVEQAIAAAWPGAHTTTRRPPPPPLPDRPDDTDVVVVGGRLRLARTDALPLKTRRDLDPLRPLLGVAPGLGDSRAVVQVYARPAVGRRLRRHRRAARGFRHQASQAPATVRGRVFDALTLTTGIRAGRGAASRSRPDAEQGAEQRATLAKAGPLWETAVRYTLARPLPDTSALGAVATRARRRAQRRARRVTMRVLRGQAHATASAFSVYAERNWLARRRTPRPAYAAASRWFGRGDVLSIAELAGLAHLPYEAGAAGLARAGAKATAPPPAIPAPGPAAKPLGVADAGARREVGLAVADANYHLHVIGETGSGKTTLMARMILHDAQHGRGGLVIDPKGDLVIDLLARLPEAMSGRVVLFDPDDPAAPPSLNVLAGPQIDLVADNLVGIFRRIFASFWGPRTDDVMRSAVLTLLTTPARAGASLADIPRLLSEPGYRAGLTGQVHDPVLRSFWSWYEQLSEGARAQAVGPLMNKLRAFLLRDFVRATIATGQSTFDMGRVFDAGGLVLARLPKGRLGEETTRLLGSFLTAAAWQAASARARLPQSRRRDASMWIDEAHNFLNLPYPIDDMLAEARAYRFSLVLAHQHLAQLPRDLAEGISANARSKVIFAASPEDARVLERHTAPLLGAHDLANLGAFQAAARLIVDGAATPAFTLRTQPLPPAASGRARVLRAAARDAFGAHTADAGRAPARDVRAGSGDPRTSAPPAGRS